METQFDDLLTGTTDNDTLNGLGGNDTLEGLEGDDTLNGGSGNDFFNGTIGNDTITGGNGLDILKTFDVGSLITASTDMAGVTNLSLGNGSNATLTGVEILQIIRINFVEGATFDFSQTDTINVLISIGIHQDSIMGGMSDDIIIGGAANDLLTGNGGQNSYRLDSDYAAMDGDSIFDFTGLDDLHFNFLDFSTGTPVGINPIFIGTAEFSAAGIAEMRYFKNGGETLVDIDGNGDGIVDSRLFIKNGEFDLKLGLSGTTSGNNTPFFTLVMDEAGISSNGTSLDDILTGGGGDDVINGQDGDDEIIGGFGDDLLNGGAGNDYIRSSGGNNTIIGGIGNDTIALGLSDNDVDAGEGDDFVFSEGGNNTVHLGTGNDQAAMGSGNDIIFGDDGQDYLDGRNGDDTLNGGDQNDQLRGGNGSDALNGDNGADQLFGGAGDDTLQGGAGGDILNGGDGIDTASYEGSTNRVIINLAAGTATSGHATGDSYESIENITGSQFADTITGNGGANIITGGGGFDILAGFTGDDEIYGGDGNDFMTGGAGADIIDGGAGGADIARYVGSNAAVTIDLGAGTASGGHADGDIITNVEFLFGSSFNDTLTGDANNNWLFGDGGNDILDGAGGIDKFFGGAGSDTFVFGAGDDFVFVTDFVDDVDQIDLTSYGYNTIADALANMSQFGAHVRFFADGDTMLILNTDLDIMANDIVI